jgi:nitroimidazol reductase NimA-like FMN-containing flavoprotein (pyridoxamine 5'-phosphate oxidase superfamily)
VTDAITGEEAVRLGRAVLQHAPVGFLALSDASGPYVVPISFALEGDVIYFHGGRGRKAQALAADPRVCLAAAPDPVFIRGAGPCKDNFDYESVLAFGRATLLEDARDKAAGMRALIAKYDPAALEAALDPTTLARTAWPSTS